ncbi:DWNN domain-containing protein [Rhodotorula diobovata]|uniref:DWNN domain-containing protein n=1 Tax=Rhodotorula diobovata TaxID=5288 RepID=A0A5C5G2J3_9BASI|nr:DWNN domain-containing protein [Rhodotorula diobovata]
MASSFVFYKFKSQREPSRIAFDGTAISVFDLKKEIIAENRMGKGADFDFAIYHADTEEEYKNDRELIPRSTSVIARRLPPARGPGRGNALDYMASNEDSGAGSNAMAGRGAAPTPRGGVGGFNKDMYTKRFDGREDNPSEVQVPVAASGDEASAMAAMFAATSSQWQQTQEQMSHAQYIPRPGQGNRPPPPQHHGGGGPGGPGGRPNFRDMPRRDPPPGYICYRCGQKGHWIQDCPKNSDPAYDNRPRIKRTTGIPKSFLTEVAGPLPGADEDDGAPGGGVKGGVMVTAEGGFVVARPDSASWLAHRALTSNLSANDIQGMAPTDPDLTCPVCSKLLRDATLTPCCNTSFCDECVTNALLDNDMLCPECETRVKSLEKLKPDDERRERCKKYVEETLEASKEAMEQEKKERKAEEERLRAAEEKRKKAEEEAAAQMVAANGGAGLPSLAMLQQNGFRLSAMLQNPALPPPMRMQLQAQLQQCQVMVMQMQNLQLMQQRMAMLMANIAAARGPNLAAPGMPPTMVQPQGVPPAAPGAANGTGPTAGVKREREESVDGSPAAKKVEAA